MEQPPMPDTPQELFHPQTVPQWRAWLEQHHARPQGVWLVSYKQATGKPRISYDEAVETALCFGWIDSKPRALDEERSALWFSPRKKGSAWSQNNKQRIERLLADGRMHASGLACIGQARDDGSWSRLDSVEALEVPPDLQLAFDAHAGAAGYFEAFPRSTRRAILEWIGNAKTAATRSRRVLETASLAARNIRANQWTKKN
jgi:uncharacterized protein YdeI (YjbR/CyaY-like superfamily)